MYEMSQIYFPDLVATPVGYQASSKVYELYVMQFISVPWLVLSSYQGSLVSCSFTLH